MISVVPSVTTLMLPLTCSFWVLYKDYGTPFTSYIY